ncbi:MAG: 30S ribosome-binding factor RbfA [Bacteroidetes bacterium]|nr:MAG: 30S ribosome-binding factor RbfA [Bacteroidota bacterium]
MENMRLNRVSKLLQKDLGEIMQIDLKHVTRGALVTVTKVKVSPDLSIAKVYLSLFATTDKNALLTDIKRHTKEIRGKLGARVRHQLRVVPELHFYDDDSLDYIENIEHLLEDE